MTYWNYLNIQQKVKDEGDEAIHHDDEDEGTNHRGGRCFTYTIGTTFNT